MSTPGHPCPSCQALVETGARFCPHCGQKVPVRSVPANEDPFIGRMVSQRYRVETRIASGGMGEVYRARHVELQQTVAVKFLHRRFADDEELAARFFNEARTAVKVKHPQAVSIYDFGRLDDGTLYLVMEFVEGEPLATRLRRDGPMTEDVAVVIALQVAEVLQRAHEQSVVHRDVKPDNIMLVDGGVGRPSIKVLDFGIAKILDDDLHGGLTQTGMMFGTPEYMAPEQAAGDPVDHRVDLYALGLVLYAMLAGHPPFEGQNKLALLQRQIHETPTPVERAAPHPVSGALADLVTRLLAKDPVERPDTAKALHAELCAIADGTVAVSPTRALIENDDDPDREPEQLELTMAVTMSGGFQLGDAPVSSTSDFDLGLQMPATSSEGFQIGDVGQRGDEDWTFGDDDEGGGGIPVKRAAASSSKVVLASGVGIGLALLVGVVLLVTGRLTPDPTEVDDPGSAEVVDAEPASEAGGSNLVAAVPAQQSTEDPTGSGDASADGAPDTIEGGTPSNTDEDDIVAVAAGADTTASDPASDQTASADSAPSAFDQRAAAAMTELRSGAVADARTMHTALVAEGAAGDAFDALDNALVRLTAWDTEVQSHLDAKACVAADRVVIEMRESLGTPVAARWYGDLDACRAAARPVSDTGSGASAGSSSSGASGSSGTSAPPDPPPRQGPPPTL